MRTGGLLHVDGLPVAAAVDEHLGKNREFNVSAVLVARYHGSVGDAESAIEPQPQPIKTKLQVLGWLMPGKPIQMLCLVRKSPVGTGCAKSSARI